MKAREDGKAYAQDVTLEELGEFLGRHDLNKTGCHYCGGKEWDIPSHEGKPVIIKHPTPSNHSDGINAFFMSCANCGRMEAFLAQTVVSRLMGWD